MWRGARRVCAAGVRGVRTCKGATSTTLPDSNLFAGVALYLSAGCALSWYCYATEARRARNFPDPSLIPTRETLLEHVRVSMFAMPFYTLYATFDDWLVCNGWTQVRPARRPRGTDGPALGHSTAPPP